MSYAQFAGNKIVANENGTIRTIAAVVASVFRIGGFAERGYAATFTAELSEAIAIARNGADTYANAGPAAKTVMFDKAYPTAKRYAEKSVGIAKKGESKGAPMLDIMKAESDEQAADIVAGWFFGPSIAAATCDELYEAFGFSTGKKKATPKVQDAPEAPAAPVASTGEEQEPEAPADRAQVSLDNALAFAASIKAVMAGSTPEARKAIAEAVIADMQAALDWTGDQAPAVEAPAKAKRAKKETASA